MTNSEYTVPVPEIEMDDDGKLTVGGSDTCGQCHHDFDTHVLVATGAVPMDGGIVLCPVARCRCYFTWGVEGAEPGLVPAPIDLAVIRADIQRSRQVSS